MKCILMVLCCTEVNIILVALQKLKVTVNSIFVQVKIPRRTVDAESAQDVGRATSQSVEYMFLEFYIKNCYFLSFMKLREYLYCMCYAHVYYFLYRYSPVPVAVRSKAWVCGLSLAGIVGSNPAGDMDVCLL